jgi:hypothetical protein
LRYQSKTGSTCISIIDVRSGISTEPVFNFFADSCIVLPHCANAILNYSCADITQIDGKEGSEGST